MKRIFDVACILICFAGSALCQSAPPTVSAQRPEEGPSASGAPTSFSPSATVPPGTTVTLAAIDGLSSVSVKEGSKVRFSVWRDVVVSGRVIIPAGTPIDAVVTRLRPASKEHHRDATVRLRLEDVEASGYHIRLTMNDDFAPENIKHRHSKLRRIAEKTGETVAVVAFAPFIIPMAIAMTPSDGKPNGDDLVLKPCFHADVYVRSAKRVRPDSIGSAAAPKSREEGCREAKESLEFDGAFQVAVGEGRLKID